MRFRLTLKHLVLLTHISVFVFTGLFVGFSTYSLTKNYFESKNRGSDLPQISQSAKAENRTDYLVYERRETVASRPNKFDRVKVTGFARNLETGDEHIIYAFTDDPYQAKFRSTTPTTVILENGLTYLHGVSNAGYALLDIIGNNLTKDFPVLAHRDFPLSNAIFGDNGDIFYSYAGINSREENDRHELYWKKSAGKTTSFDDVSFPSGPFWIRPVGWSSSFPESLYLERKSDMNTYGKVWRVNTKDSKIAQLTSVTGAMTQNVDVCPEQDLAASIVTPLDPSDGDNGMPQGPSRLAISDLVADTARIIYASNSLLKNMFVSCQGHRVLLSDDDQYRLFDFTGEEHAVVSFQGTPLFFASDGKTMIVRTPDNGISLVNVQNGKRTPIQHDDDSGEVKYTAIGISRV